MKKLYHVSQSQNRGYDTYSDFVVCAESEEEAKNTHPAAFYDHENPWSYQNSSFWCRSPEEAVVRYLGEADPSIELGIVCASFHAG